MGEPEKDYPYFLLYEAKHTYFYSSSEIICWHKISHSDDLIQH